MLLGPRRELFSQNLGGAVSANCAPEPAAASSARNATAVLPQPKSPWQAVPQGVKKYQLSSDARPAPRAVQPEPRWRRQRALRARGRRCKQRHERHGFLAAAHITPTTALQGSAEQPQLSYPVACCLASTALGASAGPTLNPARVSPPAAPQFQRRLLQPWAKAAEWHCLTPAIASDVIQACVIFLQERVMFWYVPCLPMCC